MVKFSDSNLFKLVNKKIEQHKEKAQWHIEEAKRYAGINAVWERLMDDESRDYYEACIHRVILDRLDAFESAIAKYHKTQYVRISIFDEFYSQDREGKPIILFGAGHDGQLALRTLKMSKYAPRLEAFIDNNEQLWNSTIGGLPVMKPASIAGRTDCVYVITTSKYYNQLLAQLLGDLAIPRENVFERLHETAFNGRVIIGKIEGEYFDVFYPKEKEVFVDAGCFDGGTSVDFVNWCRGDYEHIYIFEPTASQKTIIQKNLEKHGIDKYSYIAKGVWDTEETIGFDKGMMGADAHVDLQSKHLIKLTTIDKVLTGRKVTFLKLDVEGSEYKALVGAKNTIEKYKPRMAISLYHRPEDIFILPNYVIGLNCGYRFYIRHYNSSHEVGTILYAI